MKKCILIIVIFNLYSCNNDSNRELIKINDIFYSQMFKQMSESINNQNKYIDNYVGEHSYQVDSNTVRNKSILLLDSLMQNKKKISKDDFEFISNKFTPKDFEFIEFPSELDSTIQKKCFNINILNLKYSINVKFIKNHCSDVY